MKCYRSIVKWFDAKKGYGFILHPEQGPDIFVHYSQINSDKRFKTLRTGEIVDFELHDGPKGVHARSVNGTNEVVAMNEDGTPVEYPIAPAPPVPQAEAMASTQVTSE